MVSFIKYLQGIWRWVLIVLLVVFALLVVGMLLFGRKPAGATPTVMWAAPIGQQIEGKTLGKRVVYNTGRTVS